MRHSESVLFFLGHWGVGGVERVTVVLANELVARGHAVSIVACAYEDRSELQRLDGRVTVEELGPGWLSAENAGRIGEFLVRRKVSVVINQWCAPYSVTRFLRKAMRGSAAKLVAVHHNAPDGNMRIRGARNTLVRWCWRLISGISLRLVYEMSDRYVLLSDSFVPVLAGLVRRRRMDKVVVIANPLTLMPLMREKEKLIVYVGRLEETQKRVSRVIDLWRKLAGELSDWRLAIVGDGADRARYEQQAVGLPRVEFVGFQNPGDFYARARVLLLTSDFEGLPLVLAEAMAAKCIPVALGCCPAVCDVVGADGRTVPLPYDEDRFAEAVRAGVARSFDAEAMRMMAERTESRFGIGACVDQWEGLFKRLCDEEGRV